MPQTLLALLALALAGLLTFNQQRLTVRSQTNMVSNEVELAAAGLASEVMEFIGARSFDERSTPERIADALGVVPDGPDAFTNASSFGYSGDCDLLQPSNTPSCDDIDDLDDLGWTPVYVTLAHGRTLDFEIKTDVYYVDSPSSMTPSSSRTRHKRVDMNLRSDYATAGEDGILRVTRVFSYDPIKAEMDYENSEHYNSGTATEEGGGSGITTEILGN